MSAIGSFADYGLRAKCPRNGRLDIPSGRQHRGNCRWLGSCAPPILPPHPKRLQVRLLQEGVFSSCQRSYLADFCNWVVCRQAAFRRILSISSPLRASMRRASKRYPDTHVLSSPRALSQSRTRHCEERSDAAIHSGQSTAGRRGLTPLPRKGDSFVRGLPRRLRRSQ